MRPRPEHCHRPIFQSFDPGCVRRLRIIGSETRWALQETGGGRQFDVARHEMYPPSKGLEKSKTQFALQLTSAVERRFRRPVSLPYKNAVR
jgi:hypothetical protein